MGLFLKVVSIATAVFFWNPYSYAANPISVNYDGKVYSCVEKGINSPDCVCRFDSGDTNFYLNGLVVKTWRGKSADQMVQCITYAKTQEYCSKDLLLAVCRCDVKDPGDVHLLVNDASVKYWRGKNGEQMVACEQFKLQQAYCK